MLRRLLIFFVAFSLAISILTFPASGKTETIHFSFKGPAAFSFFSSVDETGCIFTDVHVSAAEGMVHEADKPETRSQANVSIFHYNLCTGENLLTAFGSTSLAPNELVITPGLNKATLNTRVVVEHPDFDLVFPVDVSMTWTGVGEIDTVEEHIQEKSPGFKFIYRLMSAARQAEASGTLIGLGANFTPEPSIWAEMANVKSGQVVIVHDP